MTKEQRYRVLLWLVSLLFLMVFAIGITTVYQSYRQCKVMEQRERYQLERYEQIKNKFEMQQEHIKELEENPDFMEHVARERIQFVEERELLFRFE